MKPDLNRALATQLKQAGLPEPEREVRFHPTRRWRFDLAWPEHKLAVEVDGGIWIGGGHNRGAQMLKDMEKANEAVILGWRVLRVGPNHVKSGEAVAWIARALGAEIEEALR